MTDRIRHAAPEPSPAPDEPLLRHLIGDALRRARRERGLTLREVAEAARVSLPYLSEIERGRKEPSSEAPAAVYRALDLRLADLLGGITGRLSPVCAPVSAPHRTTPAAQQALALAA